MGGRILVIDGDRDTRDVLHAGLTHAGCEVVTAETAEAGIALAHASPFDLVITEFLIPTHSGRCVVETLHTSPDTAAVPVVVWTASALPEIGRRVLRAGGIYWTKPARLTEILPEVAELLRAVRSTSPQETGEARA